jgi:serine/threonine protein kinase
MGHYAIRRKIGAGGMGAVDEAYDERLERALALKMMLGIEHGDAARIRFWREARAASIILSLLKKAVLVAAVDVAADDGYAAGR